MNENFNKKITNISLIIKDYRYLPEVIDKDSIASIELHVKKWISQFALEDREFVLDHTYNLFSKNYYSEICYNNLLSDVAKNKDNKRHFSRDCFVSIQSHGGSQDEITGKLNKFIQDEIGFSLPILSLEDDKSNFSRFNYITYLDDLSFSGKLIGDDIEKFITDFKLDKVKIRILVFLAHSQGLYNLKKRLCDFVKNNKLDINFHFNRRFWGDVENSVSEYHSWKTSTYFPEQITCDEVLKVKGLGDVELYQPNCFRVDSNDGCILGNTGDRRRIEKIFSSIGFDIISKSVSPKRSMKPLGFSTYHGFGFGGNVFSYRNCPNNTPLVFWWGSYEKTGNAAIDCWYPLMKRRGYYD
ncbi:phosphoribosyltransferase-like protein [Aeromonas salmonicida]|uniref:phosphoribosyltransferase-like protein n=1 Tax=Aeromonas salmonicida TaxID=645 RepID=UPI003F7B74DB